LGVKVPNGVIGTGRVHGRSADFGRRNAPKTIAAPASFREFK
jgi:hypothetical protein